MNWPKLHPRVHEEFYGTTGTRKKQLDELHTSLSWRYAIIHIYGVAGIGKTSLVKAALDRLQQNERGKLLPGTDYSEPFTEENIISRLQKLNPGFQPLSTSRPRRRSETVGLLEELVRQITTLPQLDFDRSNHIALHCCLTDLRLTPSMLERIFQPMSERGWRVFLEARRHLSFPPILATGAFSECSEVLGLEESECRELVRSWLPGHSDELFKLVDEVIAVYAGKHPGLIVIVCEQLQKREIPADSDFSDLCRLIDQRLHRDSSAFSERLASVWDSLTEEAQNSARSAVATEGSSMLFHQELRDFGLTTRGPDGQERLVQLLSGYLEQVDNDRRSMLIGGKDMAADFLNGAVVGGWALKKVLDAGHGALQTLWEDVFPPTPLYVEALEQAALGVAKFWPPPVPVLGVKKAFERSRWQQLDYRVVHGELDVSQDQVKNALLACAEDGNNVQEYIERVLVEADKLFLESIAIKDRKQAGADLWIYYIKCLAEEQGKTQSQMLSELSEKVEKLTILLVSNPKTGQVDAVDRVLKVRGREKQPKQAEYIVQRDMELVERRALVSQYNIAWADYWETANHCDSTGMEVVALRNREKPGRPLSGQESEDLQKCEKTLRYDKRRLSKLRSTLRQLNDELNTIAHRADGA